MLMNIPSCLNRVEILPPISDHDIVLVEADITPKRVKPPARNVYVWRKGNWDTLRQEFEIFANDYLALDKANLHINTLWNLIKEKINTLVKDHVPTKTIKPTFRVPWIDDGIRRLIRRRDRYRTRTKHRRWDPQVSAKLRKMKSEIQRKTRTKYWKYVHFTLLGLNDPDDPASDNSSFTSNCSKRFYAFLKSQRTESGGVSPLKKDGYLISDAQGKANVLNEQFTSVFSKDDDTHTPDLGPSPHPSMRHVTVTQEGVLKLLQSLKPHKAAGPDEIHPRVLKELSIHLAPVLTDLFQRSLDSGQVPDDWKEANVAPAFKKGEKYKASNYRPISLTSVVCKLLEHIVASNMMAHLDNNHILYDLQHGFRAKRSTVTQLISLYDDLVSTRLNKVQTDVIIMDFAKAFDKVCHRLLGLKLDHYGIRNQEHTWIMNFLNGRSQTVVVEGRTSERAPVSSGVPQGTVLGPILFLVYINDIAEKVKHSQVRLFADDCILKKEIRTVSDCTKLQEDIDIVGQWEKTWLMEFHPDKCQILTIPSGKLQPPISTNYNLHGITLERPEDDCIKYLGVTIQSDLKWDSHVQNITSKASQTVGMLKRNIRIRDPAPRELAYKTLVRPKVEYASPVWDPPVYANTNDDNRSGLSSKVERIQRRGARFVCRSYRHTADSSQMIADLGWKSLESRRKQDRLTTFFKLTHDYASVPSHHLPTPNPNTKGTRVHAEGYRPYQGRLEMYRYSFFPRTVPEWNSLKFLRGVDFDDIKAMPLGQFKSGLAEELRP